MKVRKGIVLAGGSGTRLNPMTNVMSKQMLQVYDKPMIYYPISTLMLTGIRDILIISTPEHIIFFKQMISYIGNIGVNFEFKVQENPNGIAESLILAEDFLNGAPSALILGDNIFFGNGLSSLLQKANQNKFGAQIFSYTVKNPNQYGVIQYDKKNKASSIIEKPIKFISNKAVTGLYFYDETAPIIAKQLTPSSRGELEITDLNLHYMNINDINIIHLTRGYAWLDTGTPDGLLDSANFIATIEKRQGIKIACPEEISWRMSWIDDEELTNLAKVKIKSDYGKYLINLLEEKND